MTPRTARIVDGLGIAIVLGLAVAISLQPWQNDGYAYWSAWQHGLYDRDWLVAGGYFYTPAFAQIIWPLTQIPFEAVWPLLVGAQALALLAVAGPRWAALALLLPIFVQPGMGNPVLGNLRNGNVTILLGAALDYGVRYPAAWAFVLLTKVTPGIGLLWFAVRREWRNLAIALGATGAAVAVSLVIAPHLWVEWISLMAGSIGTTSSTEAGLVGIPLIPRLVAAGILTAWGARTERPWVVPLAGALAVPGFGVASIPTALGALLFLRHHPLAKVDRGGRPGVGEGVDRREVRRVGEAHRGPVELPRLAGVDLGD